jgi:hypothetical protein
MTRLTTQRQINRSIETAPALGVLLSRSEDEFYSSLQRIWNSVLQLEDMGLIHDEHEKFVYAYRFAEEELHRAFVGKQ